MLWTPPLLRALSRMHPNSSSPSEPTYVQLLAAASCLLTIQRATRTAFMLAPPGTNSTFLCWERDSNTGSWSGAAKFTDPKSMLYLDRYSLSTWLMISSKGCPKPQSLRIVRTGVAVGVDDMYRCPVPLHCMYCGGNERSWHQQKAQIFSSGGDQVQLEYL